MNGCTNPHAKNFNPAATTDDGSCVYLDKIEDACYWWKDLPPGNTESRSFTLSFSVEKDNWVFFHDYIPDFYFHTREALHALKLGGVYQLNAGGVPGKYFNADAIKPFFIDLIFKTGTSFTTDAVAWVSESLDIASGQIDEFTTFTHVTLWNSHQSTGKIPVTNLFQSKAWENSARVKNAWVLSDFKDAVKNRGQQFIQDIFHDFRQVDTNIQPDKAWFEQMLIDDDYVILRLEFDNSQYANQPKTVYLHDATINPTKDIR